MGKEIVVLLHLYAHISKLQPYNTLQGAFERTLYAQSETVLMVL